MIGSPRGLPLFLCRKLSKNKFDNKRLFLYNDIVVR